MPFPYSYAEHTDWETALDDCIEQLGDAHGYTCGFIYASDMYISHLDEMLASLRNKTGILHWVGSLAVGICAGRQASFDKPALAIMLANFDPDTFHVLPPVRTDINDEIDDEDVQWVTNHHPYMAILHGDPHNPRIPRLLDDLNDYLQGGFLVGGLTSSNNINYQIADQLCDGGLSGLMLSPAITAISGMTQGCSPIGPVRTITSAERNIISHIDDRSALDVFKEDIGEVLSRDLEKVGGYIFAGIPVQGSDTGDYTIRNLIGIDPENELLAIGDMVIDGDPIMFCKRDTQTAIDDMQHMLEKLKARLDGPIKGGIYVSCLGRGPNMFGSDTTEVEMIQDVLGEFPLIGFYANGEISHNRLYGFTGVLTLFV